MGILWRALMCLIAAVCVMSTAAPAWAAQYPPEPTNRRCAQVYGKVNGRWRLKTEFFRGDPIAVKGLENCARPQIGVRAWIMPRNLPIGRAVSQRDGGYWIRGDVSGQARIGQNTVVVDTRKAQFQRSITVKRTPSSTRTFAEQMASPLGIIAMIGLVLLGLFFTVLPRRRRSKSSTHGRAQEPVRKRRQAQEVPRLDTSGFRPLREKADSRS